MYFHTYWNINIFIYLIIKLESTGPDIILLKLS